MKRIAIRSSCRALVGALLIAMASPSPATLIGVRWIGDTSEVYLLDEVSGSYASVGPAGVPGLNSMAVHPSGDLYSIGGIGQLDASLVRIDPCSGSATAIHPVVYDVGLPNVTGLAFDAHGTLWAIDAGQDRGKESGALYAIDIATGRGAYIGDTGSHALQSLAVGPDGKLYSFDIGLAVIKGGGLVTIDTMTGRAQPVRPGRFEDVADLQTIAFSPGGRLWGHGQGNLYTLDLETGQETLVQAQAGSLRGMEFITDGDCDGFVSPADCNEIDATAFPGAPEIGCDGIDNDCRPETTDHTDGDGDGFSCLIDCDDADATTHPAAQELCADGIDNDCSPSTPDVFDLDEDGHACDIDCNDFAIDVHPAASEIGCDGLDNDCDASTRDETDGDLDGYSCKSDCDDRDPTINPGMPEIYCDGLDNDCDEATIDVSDFDRDGLACDVDCDDFDPSTTTCNTPCCGEVLFEGERYAVTIDVTRGGNTIITESTCDPALLNGFLFTTPGASCFTVHSDVTFDRAEICIRYDDTGLTPVQEGNLRIFACVATAPPDCELVNLVSPALPDLDTDRNIVCGLTSRLSTFVLGEPRDIDVDGIADLLDNCVQTTNYLQNDSDFDGYGDSCDCDPVDPTVHPGASEFCNSRDDDCDWLIDEDCVAAYDRNVLF